MKRTKANPLLQNALIHSLRGDGFLAVNKQMIKRFGVVTASIISNLVEKDFYFRKNFPQHNGWFFLLHKAQMEELGIGEHSIIKAKRLLKEKYILNTKMAGSPAKEWYSINYLELSKLIYEKSDPLKSQGLDPLKSQGLDPLKSQGLDPLKSQGHIIRINYKNNKLKDILGTKVPYALSGHWAILNGFKSYILITYYWNNLDNTTRHTNPDTKVYQTCVQYIDSLLNGLPLLHTKDKEPTKPLLNFIERFQIKKSILTKKWTVNELKEILSTITADLDTKKSLPEIFWNGFANRNKAYSHFYVAAEKVNIPKRYVDISREFWDIIEPQNTTINGKLYTGARTFERLRKDKKIKLSEIKETLEWYKNHINDKFIPLADDPEEFVFKWNKIKRAKERKQGEQTGMKFGTRNLTEDEGKWKSKSNLKQDDL